MTDTTQVQDEGCEQALAEANGALKAAEKFTGPRIDVRREAHFKIEAGDEGSNAQVICITVDADEGNRRLDTACIELLGEDRKVYLNPEDVERAAALISRLRDEIGDRRYVCGFHGYFDPACNKSDHPWRCPKCEALKNGSES